MENDRKDNSPVVRRVLDRIESQKITVRSKLSILAERLGIDSIGVLMFLIAVFAVDLLFFWAKAAGVFEYFRFGPLGLQALLEAFPYQWLFVGILASLAVATILKHADGDGPAPYGVLLGLFLIAVFGIGTAIAFSGLDERLADSVGSVNSLTTHHGQASIMGVVAGVDGNGISLVIDDETVFVRTSSSTDMPPMNTIMPGDRILILCQAASGNQIDAAAIRKLPPMRRMPIPPHVRFTDPNLPITQS